MDFDLMDNKAIGETQKEINNLSKIYKKKGFKEFDTWYMSDEQMIEVYKKCIKENKPYEEIYGKEEYDENTDY